MVDVVVQHQAALAEVDIVGGIEGPAVAKGLIQLFLVQPLLVLVTGQLPESLFFTRLQQVSKGQFLLASQVPVEVLHAGLAMGATGVFVAVHAQGKQVAPTGLTLDGGIQLPALFGRHGHV